MVHLNYDQENRFYLNYLALSTQVRKISPIVLDLTAGTIAFSELAVHEKEFLRRKSLFTTPQVYFDGDVNFLATSPPQLKYNKNAKFLEHLDWVSKTIEDLDGLDTLGSSELRARRKTIIMEMQEHENSLDQVVLETWELTKLQSKPMTSDPKVPKTVDTSTLRPLHTCFSTNELCRQLQRQFHPIGEDVCPVARVSHHGYHSPPYSWFINIRLQFLFSFFTNRDCISLYYVCEGLWHAWRLPLAD